MTNSGTSAPPHVCPFCNKEGLPIFPTRYAVARKDFGGGAPRLQWPFVVEGKDLALPDEGAKGAYYTLRFLRPGFLYVYDERYKGHSSQSPWSAYVVNKQGYLFEFDPYAKSAPDVTGNKTFSDECVKKGDPYIARCITVRDAKSATNVWLGFSDAMWTPSVLKNHESKDYRKAHMRLLDVTDWKVGLSSYDLKHISDFTAALPLVAEFSADANRLITETQKFLDNFIPDAIGGQAQQYLSGTGPESQLFQSRFPDYFRDIVPVGSIGFNPTEGEFFKTAAWLFSPQDFIISTKELSSLIDWGRKAAAPYRPVVMAIPDPVGVVMELNNLAILHGLEWTQSYEHQWDLSTVHEISHLKLAIENGAAKKTAQKNQEKILSINNNNNSSSRGSLEKGEAGQIALNENTGKNGSSGDSESDGGSGNEGDDNISAEEVSGASSSAGAAGEAAWEKYKDFYDNDKYKSVIEKTSRNLPIYKKNMFYHLIRCT